MQLANLIVRSLPTAECETFKYIPRDPHVFSDQRYKNSLEKCMEAELERQSSCGIRSLAPKPERLIPKTCRMRNDLRGQYLLIHTYIP